jgi:hypothetical protein
MSYGKTEVDFSNLDPREVKVRISTFVDGDVLKKLKMHAQKGGLKYQTLLNSVLRKYVESPFPISSESHIFDDAVRKIVRDELKKTGTD